jgi:hypothetical protein
MMKFTFKIGVVLSVLFSAMNSFSQFTPQEIKYWVGSGADTAYLAVNFLDEYNQNSHVWGYLYDGTKTIDDLIRDVHIADTNISITKETEIENVTMGYTIKDNSATSSWNIFTSDLLITDWTEGLVLTDELVNSTVYGVAFNEDESLGGDNPTPLNSLVFMESPKYHDESIAMVKYFVGQGDKTTVIIVDFKNPNYENSLAFGVNYNDGESLKDALDKLQEGYPEFTYDAEGFLKNIAFDTLNDQHITGYWSYKLNDLTDEIGSISTPPLANVSLSEDMYYSFVYSKGTPNTLKPVFTPSNLISQIDASDVKYWIGSGSDTAYFAVNLLDQWNQTTKVWGYLYGGNATVEDLLIAVNETDTDVTISTSTEIDTIAITWASGINTDTSSWVIFNSENPVNYWESSVVFNDKLKNNGVYLAVFNADEPAGVGVSSAINDMYYTESPTYHDDKIEKVKYFVGEGDKQTVLLVDFKNPNFKNSLAFGVNYAEGETLLDALEKLQEGYTGFTYDAGAFLNTIAFDTLNDEYTSGYWSYRSNDLTDELGSSEGAALGEVFLGENMYYSFVFSYGTPNDLRPVYSPAPEEAGSNAVSINDQRIVGWASGAEITRGYIQLDNPSKEYQGSNKATNGELTSATGGAEGTIGDVISLGDAGVILLTFDTPIENGEGYDFAVFENGFEIGAIELAFVEVSSDGVNFFRFPAVSVTQNTVQLSNSGKQDVKNIYNLAGNFEKGFGTPFDLSELSDVDGLDLYNITHVKIIDVVGTINPQFGSIDSYGNIINDPFPTAFHTGGFDLDGVAVLNDNTVDALSTIDKTLISIYPNPAKSTVNITMRTDALVSIYNMNGSLIYLEDLTEGINQLNIEAIGLSSGMYFVQTENLGVAKLIIR